MNKPTFKRQPNAPKNDIKTWRVEMTTNHEVVDIRPLVGSKQTCDDLVWDLDLACKNIERILVRAGVPHLTLTFGEPPCENK